MMKKHISNIFRAFALSALSLLAACFALSASAHAGVVLSGGGLTLVEEGGGIAPGNLAATGAAFAKDVLPGYASHQTLHLNDQLFGNGKSWIGNSAGTFAGVSFGATAVPVSSIAFGRDNTGFFKDRTLGTYTLQYTKVPYPTKYTPDSSWTTIGTLVYQSAAPGTNFAFPSMRHRYTFNAVAATGIRLIMPAGGLSAGTCVDELEAYSSIVATNTVDSGGGRGTSASYTHDGSVGLIAGFSSVSSSAVTVAVNHGYLGQIADDTVYTAVVTSADNSGPGTLRDTLAALPPSGSLTFAPGLGTITLGSEIILTKSVTIDASSLPNGITIDGGLGDNRIFSIPVGQTVTLNRLTLTGGGGGGATASGFGGAIYNASSLLTLNHCSFQGNSADGGGGIYNSSSSPTFTTCSFQGNSAQYGGGIYNFSSSSPTLTNCSFQGNSATAIDSAGGGILNVVSCLPTLTNCSFQGNSAVIGGGIGNFYSCSPILNNCIIWNNKDTSGTGTPASSVSNLTSSTPTYSHCLIQGYSKGDLDATGTSPDTNLAPNDPLFVREVDPNLAPTTTGGDLRLLTGSPALNVGDDTKNSTPTDLAGNPRKVGIIDLGAYEGNVNATFALLHPTLSPSGDANGNGISNFGDYAAGGNPSAPDDPSLRPKLIGDQLTFSYRNNATDIAKKFQKSTTLLPGSWMDMIANTDYTVSSTTISGGRSLQTLTLTSTLRTTNPKLFFRQEFKSTTPP